MLSPAPPSSCSGRLYQGIPGPLLAVPPWRPATAPTSSSGAELVSVVVPELNVSTDDENVPAEPTSSRPVVDGYSPPTSSAEMVFSANPLIPPQVADTTLLPPKQDGSVHHWIRAGLKVPPAW